MYYRCIGVCAPTEEAKASQLLVLNPHIKEKSWGEVDNVSSVKKNYRHGIRKRKRQLQRKSVQRFRNCNALTFSRPGAVAYNVINEIKRHSVESCNDPC